MLDNDIDYLLKNTSSVTNLVSTRSFPLNLKQGVALPAIAWTRISTERGLHHGGSRQVARTTVQFSIFATTPTAARSVSEALRALFHGYRGTPIDTSIYVAQVVDERDGYDYDTGDGVYMSSLDVEFAHNDG